MEEKPSEEELKTLYRKKYRTLSEIADMYWVSETQIYTWLDEYGIETYDRKESQKIKKERLRREAREWIDEVAADRFPYE